MNVCFGANAPAKADAETVAARPAKLGINGIRFHHHETQPAPRGLLRPPENGARALDPEGLDRQDYFLDRLHRHGIYANLNLHVGRSFTEAEGFENAKDLPYDVRYSKCGTAPVTRRNGVSIWEIGPASKTLWNRALAAVACRSFTVLDETRAP
ncbi:MAG: hypothetical protein BWK77_01370 [Verrucomicrobia bacterium A1]|nr:MAG: hypothetical protein BWK77_01370 [Verrucomicrobia bacterium A1]